MTSFVDRNGARVLRGDLALKLNPSCLQYLAARLVDLQRLGELKVSAPIDYLRSYISHMGDLRRLERVATFLGRVQALKLVSSLPGAGRDVAPIKWDLFGNLTVLEVHRCALPSPGSTGWRALRPRLVALRCYDAVDTLRELLDPAPVGDTTAASIATGSYAGLMPRVGSTRGGDVPLAVGGTALGRNSEDIPRASVAGLAPEESAWEEEHRGGQHTDNDNDKGAAASSLRAPQPAGTVAAWEKLTSVTCSYCQLASLDDSLLLLPAVTQLDLSRNAISSIRQLHSCVRLESLDLGFNRICSTAGWNGAVGNIRVLVLRYNALESTAGLDRLYSLEELDLSCNLLAGWEQVQRLAPLPCLARLWLMGNPISYHRNYRVMVLSFFPGRLQQLTLDSWETTTREQTRAGRLVDRRRRKEAGANYPQTQTVVRYPASASGDGRLLLDAGKLDDGHRAASRSWEQRAMVARYGSDASNQNGQGWAPIVSQVVGLSLWPMGATGQGEGARGATWQMGDAGAVPGASPGGPRRVSGPCASSVAPTLGYASFTLGLPNGASARPDASTSNEPQVATHAAPTAGTGPQGPQRAKRPHRRVAPIEDATTDGVLGGRRPLGRGLPADTLFDPPAVKEGDQAVAAWSSVMPGASGADGAGGADAGIQKERRKGRRRDKARTTQGDARDGEDAGASATAYGSQSCNEGGGNLPTILVGEAVRAGPSRAHVTSHVVRGGRPDRLLVHVMPRDDGTDDGRSTAGAAQGTDRSDEALARDEAMRGVPARSTSGSDSPSSASNGSDDSALAAWGRGSPEVWGAGVAGADGGGGGAWRQRMEHGVAPSLHEDDDHRLRGCTQHAQQGVGNRTDEGVPAHAGQLTADACLAGGRGQGGDIAGSGPLLPRVGSVGGAMPTGVGTAPSTVKAPSPMDAREGPAMPRVESFATDEGACGPGGRGGAEGGEPGGEGKGADGGEWAAHRVAMPTMSGRAGAEGEDGEEGGALSAESEESLYSDEDDDGNGEEGFVDAAQGEEGGVTSPVWALAGSDRHQISPAREDAADSACSPGPLTPATPMAPPSHGFSPHALWEVHAGMYAHSSVFTPVSEGGLLSGDSPPRFDASVLRACCSVDGRRDATSSACRTAKGRRRASQGGRRTPSDTTEGDGEHEWDVGHHNGTDGTSQQRGAANSVVTDDSCQLSPSSLSSSCGSSCRYETSSEDSLVAAWDHGADQGEVAAGQAGEGAGPVRLGQRGVTCVRDLSSSFEDSGGGGGGSVGRRNTLHVAADISRVLGSWR